jgi:hypothetical protein
MLTFSVVAMFIRLKKDEHTVQVWKPNSFRKGAVPGNLITLSEER